MKKEEISKRRFELAVRVKQLYREAKQHCKEAIAEATDKHNVYCREQRDLCHARLRDIDNWYNEERNKLFDEEINDE